MRRALVFSLLAAGIALACNCGGTASPVSAVVDGGAEGGGAESGGGADDSGLESGPVCTSDADCTSPLACGWQITEGCGVPGHCVGKPAAICNIVEAPACGCDGTAVPVLCGSPYVTRPVRSRSSC